MQAVYFIALFGLIFAVISSFTVGIGASSMQLKANKLEQMQQMFDNLEFAINNIYLKERLDLSDLPLSEGSAVSLSGEDLKVFLPYMRGSDADLIQDPWRTAIRYYALQFPEVLCQSAAPPSGAEPTNDCLVRAPTAYFVMVSAGPDRKFESGPDKAGGMPAGNTLAFLNYPRVQGSDDIVKVFSTSAPMRAHYNNMIAVEDRVSALVLKSYRDQSAAFFQTKDVKNYIEARLTQQLGNGGFFPDDGDVVGEPGGGGSCTGKECPPNPCPDGTRGCFPIDITKEEIYGNILTKVTEARDWPGYPRMRGTASGNFNPGTSYPVPADAYGAQSELQYDPFCVASTGDTKPSASNCTPITINYDEQEPWRVTITRDIVIPRGWFVSTLRTLDGKEDL